MPDRSKNVSIAIVGGGPSGLLMFKRLVLSGLKEWDIHIFEAKDELGKGMPYSKDGAGVEHITNVSGNEIPSLVIPLKQWVMDRTEEQLKIFGLQKEHFTDYKVVPRLLFGQYLNEQFHSLQEIAKTRSVTTKIHFGTKVADIAGSPENKKVMITVEGGKTFSFDQVVICTGHEWPTTYENNIPGYYDSPYPPSKLTFRADHPVAIRGSSLTAIDAIRTVARTHGDFVRTAPHELVYVPDDNAKDLKIIMHSRQGLLPAIRFHLDDPKLSKSSLMTKEQIAQHRKENNGFLSLDLIFEKDFKELFADKDPDLYARIRDLNMEQFVDLVMKEREQTDPFILFKKEYAEAVVSIEKKESIYWKEQLATLSFAMNYPAKHFSAEDMQRLQHILMPLIAVVIAFVPQSSCEELIALYDAGRLELVAVGEHSEVKVDTDGKISYHFTNDHGDEISTDYKVFIDCVGQRHLSFADLPFKSLVDEGMVSPARLAFRSPEAARSHLGKGRDDIEKESEDKYFLRVPGIAIDDRFRIIGKNGQSDPRIHMMAVPYIGGFNPDYSGLDFCEEASKIIVDDLNSWGR